MRISIFLFCAIIFLSAKSYSQVSINSDGSAPNPAAMLEVKSDSKGFLLPRLTTTKRDAIAMPTPGLMIYNSSINKFQAYASLPGIPSSYAFHNSGGSIQIKTQTESQWFGIEWIPQFTGFIDSLIIGVGSANLYAVINKGTVLSSCGAVPIGDNLGNFTLTSQGFALDVPEYYVEAGQKYTISIAATSGTSLYIASTTVSLDAQVSDALIYYTVSGTPYCFQYSQGPKIKVIYSIPQGNWVDLH